MKKIGADVRTESMSCVIFLNLNALLSFRDWSGRSLEVWKTEYILGSTHVFPLWTGAWCWRGGSWIGQCVMYGTIIIPVPANTRYLPNAVSMLVQLRRRWANIETDRVNASCLLGVPPYYDVILVRVDCCMQNCLHIQHIRKKTRDDSRLYQCWSNINTASDVCW